MEGLFVLPGLVEVGRGVQETLSSQEGRSSPENGNLDFGQLLEESVKKAGEGMWGTPFTSLRICQSCGSGNLIPEEEPTPCSFASTTSLACSSNASSLTTMGSPSSRVDLSEVRASIAQFLEDLEGINFTLDLGAKGVVKVEGMKNENGEFSFQIQGSKDALTELFTMLFGYLTTMVQGEVETQNCSQNGSCACGGNSTSCGGVSSGAALENLLVGTVTPSEGENSIDTELPVTVEGVSVDEEAVPDEENGGGADEEVAALPDNAPEKMIVGKPRGVESDAIETSSSESGEGSSRAKVETRSPERVGSLTPVSDEVTTPRAEVVSSEGKVVSVASLGDSKEVEKIFDSILRFASRGEGPKEVVVKLQPESLGSIIIHLKEDANRLQCVWEIADVKTRELIQKSLPLLEARLQGQGFTFE
ncbi:MAG: flagellar hook-length control protein FliK, partial [Candidatus Caldatribacteriaceae bacterium]